MVRLTSIPFTFSGGIFSLTIVALFFRYGAPAPLFCRPKSDKNDFTGSWDYGYMCNDAWANPPRTCSVYEGQKAGGFDNSEPVANGSGRTDVEG